MSEVKPMRMSDWGTRPPGPAMQLPPAAQDPPPPRDPGSLPPSPAKNSAPKPPTIWNGFDLLRFPTCLLRRWYVPVPLALIGLVLGIAAGFVLLKASYSVTVRLIVRNPQSFAVSDKSYSPSKLQPTTLLGAIKSPQVARAVADRMALNLPPPALLSMIEVAEVKKTEFVDIIVTTQWPPAETAKFATSWAEEALNFTRKIQSEESVEMKSYLVEQLRRTDLELEEVNRKITKFTEERDIVNTDKEMDHYLASIADLNVRYETDRVDLQAIEHRLASLQEEIRKHSPTFDDLKRAEIKLQELGEYYTDKNPIYLDEADKVEALRRKVNEELTAKDMGASDFTGTFVGNALYMQIIELEAKRDSLTRQNEQVKKMLDESRAKLKELPAVALEMAPLLESNQALRSSKDVLLKRMQEVEVFENLAPGYYRLFKTPTAKDVVRSGRTSKCLVFGVLLALVFGALGAAAVMGLEFLDTTVKTRAEAEALLGVPCTYAMPPDSRKAPDYFGQELWAEVVGPLSPSGRIHAFWQPCQAAQAEHFWETLIGQAGAMGVRVLVVHLAGGIPASLDALPRVGPHEVMSPGPSARVVLWELPPDVTLDSVKSVIATLHSARSVHNEIWLQADGIVREPGAALARSADRTTFLFSLDSAVRDFWSTQQRLLTASQTLGGFITMDRKP